MVERERQPASPKTTRPTDGLEPPAGEPGRADGLPIAPEPAPAPDATAGSRALQQLVRFEAFGQRPADARGSTDDAWPALLHAYRDLAHIRHDFPLVQPAGKPGAPARPLTEQIDALLAQLGDAGDDGERLRRHLYRLEAEIRQLAEAEPGAQLTTLWDQAAAALLARGELRAKDKQLLQTNLLRARQALTQDGALLACGADLPGRLLAASLVAHWADRCASWREELGALIGGLKDLLRADFDRSPAAKTAEHLRESAATASDVDFDAMSSLLSGVPLGERLEPARRQRITAALSTLLEVEPLFGENPTLEQPAALAPIRDALPAAIEAHAQRTQLMTGFFRAVQIARLELDNHYREDTHDALFARFDASLLSAEERALCPPVVAQLSPAGLASTGIGAVLECLAASPPLKLLVEVDDLCPAGLPESPERAGAAARLASMASALADTYVLQAPVSRPLRLQAGFREGLAHAGPALFSVYTGSRHTRLPTYLDAEAAVESRAFPAWCYDPGRGETQAERSDLHENSQPERAWPVEAFRYRTASGEERTAELAFTLADFLHCDRRLAAHFWRPDPGLWHPHMVPLQDYLALEPSAATDRIPYLSGVDAEGRVTRIVMTARLADSVADLARRWRAQQEAGGINNSFALELLAAEAARLAEQKAAEVAAIEARYAGQLEQDIGALTQEIVARIAAQLIGGAGSPVPFTPPIAPPPAQSHATETAPGPAEPAAKAEAEPDEDEPLSFDEPYIETPLCTSCNDCTNQYPHLFAYDENKQAYIKDPQAGTFRELVLSAELCPVGIIHPGKPSNPDEPGLDEWVKRAARFT